MATYYTGPNPLQLPQQPPTPLQEVHEVQQPIQPVQPVYNANSSGPDRPRRTRRRYEEVPRIYLCNYGDCDRGYSTLNHLNTHVNNKNHGPKRLPSEFQALRARLRQEARSRNTQVANASYANEMATRMVAGQVHPHAHVMATMEQQQAQRRQQEALHVQGALPLLADQPRLAPGPLFNMQVADVAANFQFPPVKSSAADRPYPGQFYNFDSRSYNQGYNFEVYGASVPDPEGSYGSYSGGSSQRTSPVAASSRWSPGQAAYSTVATQNPFHWTQAHPAAAPSPSLYAPTGAGIHASGWSGVSAHDDPQTYGQHRPSDASQTSSVPTMTSDTTRPTTATTAVESPSGDYTCFSAPSSYPPFDTCYNVGTTCNGDS